MIHAVDLKDRKVGAADAKDIKPAGKNCVRVVSGFFENFQENLVP